MAQLVDAIKALYGLYPPWLVTACLAVLGLALGWAAWKIVRFGMVVLLAGALFAIVAAVGWMIFVS